MKPMLFEDLHGTQTQHILNMVVVNQPIHWFLGGKGLGIQQGTSVWVGFAQIS